MKKIGLVIVLIVFGLTSEIFGEEKVLVTHYFDRLRWCPDGNAIAFVANFMKEDSQSRKWLITTGIGKIKPDGSDLQIIISYPWLPYGPMIHRREKNQKQKQVYPGDYKPPPSPPQPVIPLFSIGTEFEWSADGKKIIFADSLTSFSDNDEIYIWTVNSDGTNLRQIFKTDIRNLPCNFQRLENGKIAFRTKARESFFHFFHFLNPENGKIEGEINLGGPWPAYEYSLSPDGKKVLFEDKSDIFVVDLARRTKVNITNIFKTANPQSSARSSRCESPVWSSDSKKIAFVFQPGMSLTELSCMERRIQQTAIWVIDVEGTNSRPISAIPDEGKKGIEWAKDSHPAWSPDEKTIAFIREYSKRIGGESQYSIETVGTASGDQKLATIEENKKLAQKN